MSIFRVVLLAIAALPVSAGVAQTRHPRPPVVAPPPLQIPPIAGRPRVGAYPIFNDNLIRIYFDYDSASLSPTAERIVDLVAERALRCPYPVIAIAGHVDTATRRSRAQPLSRRMAETVRQALISRGIHPGDVRADGYGTARPAIDTGPKVREPYNRRVEIETGCNRTARGRTGGLGEGAEDDEGRLRPPPALR